MALTLYDIYEQNADGNLTHIETVRASTSTKAVAVMLAGERSQRDVSDVKMTNYFREIEKANIVPGNWVVIARSNQTALKRSKE
jgi:hypothetical protein